MLAKIFFLSYQQLDFLMPLPTVSSVKDFIMAYNFNRNISYLTLAPLHFLSIYYSSQKSSPLSLSLPLPLSFWFFKTEFLCVALPVLELTL